MEWGASLSTVGCGWGAGTQRGGGARKLPGGALPPSGPCGRLCSCLPAGLGTGWKRPKIAGTPPCLRGGLEEVAYLGHFPLENNKRLPPTSTRGVHQAPTGCLQDLRNSWQKAAHLHGLLLLLLLGIMTSLPKPKACVRMIGRVLRAAL